MVRQILFLLFIVATAITIWYLSDRINAYDLRFYHGKDNGYLTRIESICILSSIFWLLMSDYSKIKNKVMLPVAGFFSVILGLIVGLLSSIASYILIYIFDENSTTQLIF